MKTNIHGIAAIQINDESGDSILIAGANITKLQDGSGVIRPEMSSANIGTVTLARKILTKNDCMDERDRALFDVARGHPFIRVDGTVDLGQASVSALSLFFGLGGKVFERRGGLLVSTLVDYALLTTRPLYRETRVFIG